MAMSLASNPARRAVAIQIIPENKHNITTYPIIDMLLDGEKVGTFSAACN